MTPYERIDEILNSRQLSRRALARLAGIKETTLAGLFARKPEVFPDKYLDAISKALNVSKAYLQGFADTPNDGVMLDNLTKEIKTRKQALDNETEKMRLLLNSTIKSMDSLSVLLLSFFIDNYFEYVPGDKQYYLNDDGIALLATFARKEHMDIRGDEHDPQEQ